MESKKKEIKMSFEPNTRKYYGQQCQDDNINMKFRDLHKKIINEIITFCKENNIIVDEIHLNADGVAESIPYGEWQACTDSYFGLNKFSNEYIDVITTKKQVTDKEWKLIKAKQEPFIFSM